MHWHGEGAGSAASQDTCKARGTSSPESHRRSRTSRTPSGPRWASEMAGVGSPGRALVKVDIPLESCWSWEARRRLLRAMSAAIRVAAAVARRAYKCGAGWPLVGRLLSKPEAFILASGRSDRAVDDSQTVSDGALAAPRPGWHAPPPCMQPSGGGGGSGDAHQGGTARWAFSRIMQMRQTGTQEGCLRHHGPYAINDVCARLPPASRAPASVPERAVGQACTSHQNPGGRG